MIPNSFLIPVFPVSQGYSVHAAVKIMEIPECALGQCMSSQIGEILEISCRNVCPKGPHPTDSINLTLRDIFFFGFLKEGLQGSGLRHRGDIPDLGDLSIKLQYEQA
jgi:hypothetical protein